MTESTHNLRVLVIGVGALERGDDAAGRLAARQIMASSTGTPLDVIELRGEAMALMDAWSNANTVILIDAMSAGNPVGSVSRWDASAQPMPAEMARGSTHDMGVPDAIELARAMGMLPARVIVYGIEIQHAAHGSEPSPQVISGIEQAARSVIDEALQLTEGSNRHA